MLPTNSAQLKLFDKKFVALTLRDARHCEKCKREYDIKYKYSTTDNKPHSSRPVLLICGHNICENCIYLHRNNLKCAVCSVQIEFEHTRWLKKSYDLNFCLLGQLMNSQSFLSSEAAPGAAIYNQTSGMLAQESFIQKCSECEQAPAIGICMHCKVDFCKRCFTAVHQNSKVLKKHRMSEFEMQTLQLHLPKERMCKMHKRLCDKFCSDCQNIFCSQCIRAMHGTHRTAPLEIENANHTDKIISFLETMKQTRDHIKKAQKDTRVCENRLEDFATAAILEVSDYFLELHNFLQLEERRIIDDFKKSARSSQNAINDACAKLSDCQTTLNNMRSSLEGYLHKPPHGFHINAVIELATIQLEQLPCQIQISTIENNPFVFKKLKDIRKDISKSYEVAAHDPEISFRITPMYGDLASFEFSSERAVSPEPLSLERLDPMDHGQSTMSISLTSTIAVGKNKRVGRVTNIISPSQFYVQSEEGMSEVRPHLLDIDGNTGFVESINPGEMYLVYHATDKAWFRGIVKEELKRPKQFKNKDCVKYKVFLLDYGIFEEIQKKCLRRILDNVRAIPAASVSCGLLDVAPVGKEWPSEACELMEEIIQNKPVQVIIQDTTKSPWNVEIFALNGGEPVSIREALIYTGMAVDSSASISQRNIKFAGAKPIQVSKMKQRLQRQMLHSEEFFRVKITHIENPQQFFAIKFSQLEELANLQAEMDLEYSNKQSDTIYYAQLHMCCALFVEGKWYRGCVEEINNPNDIRVRLVDDGRSVTVNWRQLHVLNERFLSECELSIECSLADVQALQKNDYEWTETAIAEFMRMTSNPNIHMTITSSSQFRYQVILNVVKKHLDINIGAMLVKFNHALTTGEASAGVENVRDKKSPIDPLLIANEKPKPTDSIFRTLKRTSVQVIHINTPGEFYIHLVEHIPGILKFHEELQLAQEKRQQDDSIDSVEWQVNDHCMVFTNVTESAFEQWFRGVILEKVTAERYVVFLRDKGLTVRDLRVEQLTPIADLFDRICNAATLCHLACVHPTGGMKTWSHSSIDEFVHHVSGFESLGATIQGATVNCSIPVVLWGMMTETNDPLAPCTTKYTNINKILVSAGLAHLSEKIDLTRQLDQFVEAELEHGQQTLQDWYENFKKTVDELPECLDDIAESEAEKSIASGLQISEPMDEYGTATEWLPAQPIEKTVFTAYPTYVDDEAIVYLHDADKHTLLNKMKTKINKDVELKPLMANEKWVVGQPCLARYHLDNSLYRACIHRKVTDLKYEVRFIDYGNIEACDARDLHKMMAFPHIPTQAVRFRIDGITPRGEQTSFPVTVLDLIHGVIVDKLCGIRVPNGQQGNEIKRCSIRFDRNDLATYLIQNGFVAGVGISKPITTTNKKSTQLPHWPLTVEPEIEEKTSNSDDELREFMKHQICDPTLEIAPYTPPPEPQDTVAMFNPDEYRRMFEKMQNAKFYKSVKDIDSAHSSPLDGAGESDEDDDVVELEFSFRSNYWNADNNVESAAPPMLRSDEGSNFEKFVPLDSSSLLSNFSGIEAFKQPQLPTSVTSFYCDVGYVRSPTILHIFPHLSELEYRQVELARRIQIMVPRMAPLVSFDLKAPCIARYSKDKLWYRAIIRSHNATVHQVKVFYVDFLNTELVAEEYVRNCPMELLSWPLRTFEMKLFGLKTNPRMREKDVKQAVSKCLKGRTLYAKIIRARGKMTEVCLFNSKAEKEIPVYEDLILQKYFCKE